MSSHGNESQSMIFHGYEACIESNDGKPEVDRSGILAMQSVSSVPSVV
jgi:hypothetical protein